MYNMAFNKNQHNCHIDLTWHVDKTFQWNVFVRSHTFILSLMSDIIYEVKAHDSNINYRKPATCDSYASTV